MEKLVIFYADDDLDDIQFLYEIANQLGITQVTFLNGEGLLDAMYNPPPKPDFVFVDLNMPMKSGFELIREIKVYPFFKDIPVIVLSTANDHKTVTLARRTGADYFITKPNSAADLLNAIAYTIKIDWKNNRPTIANFHHKNNAVKSEA